MNFEFKSTFNKLKTIDHSIWIAAIVAVSFTALASLYLSNQVIPATYGSKPNGDDWVYAIRMCGYVWSTFAAYAAIRLVVLFTPTRIKSPAFEFVSSRWTYLTDASRILFLQLYMLTTLMLREPPRSRYSRHFTVTPLTYINYILTF